MTERKRIEPSKKERLFLTRELLVYRELGDLLRDIQPAREKNKCRQKSRRTVSIVALRKPEINIGTGRSEVEIVDIKYLPSMERKKGPTLLLRCWVHPSKTRDIDSNNGITTELLEATSDDCNNTVTFGMKERSRFFLIPFLDATSLSSRPLSLFSNALDLEEHPTVDLLPFPSFGTKKRWNGKLVSGEVGECWFASAPEQGA